MNSKIASIKIGQKISVFRKAKGYSQEELAKLIGISRSSLTQIEAGNRGIDILELQKISAMLNFSIDELLQEKPANDEKAEIQQKRKVTKDEIRISLPRQHVSKFRNVLLYILEQCAGKPNVGETVLYKLLYFCDFNYYELYEEHLTGSRYRKLPFGPVPQKIDDIIHQMIEKGELHRMKSEYHNYPQTRYIPLVKANLQELKASEKEVIDRVVDQMSNWTASMISSYSHGDKPWKATENKDYIDYELVFYRQPPYSLRIYDDNEQDTI